MSRHPARRSSGRDRLQLAPVIGALSYAFDLAEGHAPGHSLRACWIGMHVGEQLGLEKRVLHDLYYTLLLKDAGCSNNAARTFELFGYDDVATKRAFRWVDLREVRHVVRFVFGLGELRGGFTRRLGLLWNLLRNGDALHRELTELRCERGSEIALQLGFGADVAAGVFSVGEHWDGAGRPVGLAGTEIHVGARIALLAQVVELFHAAAGRDAALLEVRRRSGTWFDPALVDAFASAVEQPTFWSGLVAAGLEKRVEVLEPGAEPHALTDERLDGIALAFADVIDSKSAYTIRHSRRVAEYADAVGRELGLFPANRRWLRRAALLHDVGKLGLSNAILDKRGTLDESERVQVRRFPAETEEILGRIDPFRRAAAARRGGGAVSASGETDPIPLETRIITVCDIYDALTSERPHRPAMSAEQAFDVLGAMHDAEIDPTCVAALVACLRGFGGTATRRAAA